MAKIYVASSWRNKYQPGVVKRLRDLGHAVYDFREPEAGSNGFHWSEIDPGWKDWSLDTYRRNLKHEIACHGFRLDMEALIWSDIVLGVQPFGRSASLELGWAAGAGKITMLLLDNAEPELMVNMIQHIATNMDEIEGWIGSYDEAIKQHGTRDKFRDAVVDVFTGKR